MSIERTDRIVDKSVARPVPLVVKGTAGKPRAYTRDLAAFSLKTTPMAENPHPPAANHPAANHPPTNHPAANHPAANRPAANHPAANHPAANHPPTEKHEDDHGLLDVIAHEAHEPHGALHAVEVGEKVSRTVSRTAWYSGRAATAAAEVVGGHHVGWLGRFEHWVARGLKLATTAGATVLARVPGGMRAIHGLRWLRELPGHLLGPRLDALVSGTRLGRAVEFSGAGARTATAVGGRIPIIGAIFGAAIAVVDGRRTLAVLMDPSINWQGKTTAALQGLLSIVSGALGAVAVAGAFGVAIGVMAPFAIHSLLGAAAIAGLGAFVLSFMVPETH